MDNIAFIFGPDVEGLPAGDAARRSASRFVRSEGQLAVYEAARKPTGHVLTSWEAFTAYGLNVLEEAVEYGSAILKQTRDSTASALEGRRKQFDLSHKSVGKAAGVQESDVKTAESSPPQVPLRKLERIAFALGLDERSLAFKTNAGGDEKLAYRLRTLVQDAPSPSKKMSAGTALLFAEAASIIRVQLRLQKWLEFSMGSNGFSPSSNYGWEQNPSWRIGYQLARDAREKLELGRSPIFSMRDLVESQLGIPVIQAKLRKEIAGATVMTIDEDGNEARGVVLNTVGENENVWIRRATLAHELGHLLYDPDEQLQNVRVDSYADNRADPQATTTDFVEQRANAFAIAFLAPIDTVQDMTPPPITAEAVSDVMRTFGISHTAARYHAGNCHYRNYNVPSTIVDTAPTDEQKAAEDFTVDYFPISDTPIQRRGRFSGVVTANYDQGLISEHTAAFYLGCSVEDSQEKLESLRTLYA